MATLALSVAGSAAGSAIGIGPTFGRQLGAALGGQIDGALFGSRRSRHREGPRLEQLSVQTSTYGDFIPIVYGKARIAGNVIWARPMKEVATTTTSTQSGGKGGGSVSSSVTEFSYFATLAVAICEGELETIERVWADAKQLDLGQGTYRFYTGSQEQLPDTLIESFEGIGRTPAYRGLSYVVIEDFPLADYGNRIPNFTFEVKRKPLSVGGAASVESQIKEMVLIPGSGEFVYDTAVQTKLDGELVNGEHVQGGQQTLINRHTPQDKANAVVALDQLEETCPNLEWVALVVNWFGTSMDMATCDILPGVEFVSDNTTTQPEVWNVGNYVRGTAHPITYVDGTPRYGGTPDDQSVQRLCDELKARGKKILFLPLFLMDTDGKPWRGRLTGDAAQIPNFFTKPTGYNEYVIHYANILKTKVDAFAIGSEMIGITSVNDGASANRQFPGVTQLVSLAATVKGIVGPGVQVTYAADWSEYHHAEGGWYNMDPLWASPNINVMGIDAYFPLTDAAQSELGYDAAAVQQGWTSGEGYDWFYSDAERTVQTPLQPQYAWKNIEWFWKNTHVNPDGNSTAWVPESKKIWFTEYGFPSVDGATNQPNVFYDPTSTENAFPRFSKGRADFRAQRTGIAATLAQWNDPAMVEKLFLWTWDARPYPYWPDLLAVWADGGSWLRGHWVQGKIGSASLAAIVADVCTRTGLAAHSLDVARLTDQVEGMVISRQDSARDLIEMLMEAYFFDAAETDGLLKFMPRGNASVVTIGADDLAPESGNGGEALTIDRAQELELPQRVEVNYLNRLSQYQTSTQASQRQVGDASGREVFNLPIVMDGQRAKTIADVTLFQRWMARTRYSFDVAMRYADIEPADVITVSDSNGTEHTIRVAELQMGKPGRVRVQGVAEDVATYDFYTEPAEAVSQSAEPLVVPDTQTRLLDLPALPIDSADDSSLRVAAAGLADGWNGAVLYRSDDGGNEFGEVVRSVQPAIMGTTTLAPGSGPRNRFDETSNIEVVLLGDGALSGVSELSLLNGANVAVVGDELIQFQWTELIAPNKYRLSRLLRGRMGTESAIAGHSVGESFVLLNTAVRRAAVPDGLFGLARDYKAVSVGQTLGSVSAQSFTYQARALRPYSPAHVTGSRDGAGDLTIRWVRRTRSGGHLRDGGDVPLSEASERYEVDVLDGSDVVRTISVVMPEISYSATDQISDFGTVQNAVNVLVYQLSERVGRGDPVAATI